MLLLRVGLSEIALIFLLIVQRLAKRRGGALYFEVYLIVKVLNAFILNSQKLFKMKLL
jgi:hypothetical protein